MPGSWGNARKGEVFLVSGHTGSAGVLSIVAWRLSRQGFRVHLLAPPPGRRGALEGLCRTVARRGDPAVSSWLLGYGIGGLFARGLAERPELGSRLRGIVTLGTPHRPTLAYPWRFWFRRFSARTTLGPRAPRDVEAVVLFSTFDASLVPLDSGYWPGAFHIRVHNVGHFGLLFSARAFRLVREQMEA
ncbi:MAG: hypothetical protein KatS3mg076_0320 [Candidatus Binatia bacterium]|nr:MAG: hypothetical protein KatS3mg076_0320 [Candidatus Binatia bacterium]